MLLLLTILLVLIAAVTLLIGIFGNNLTLIYVSIGASFHSAIVLAVLSQMSKRRGPVEVATAPAPLDDRTSTRPAAIATADALAPEAAQPAPRTETVVSPTATEEAFAPEPEPVVAAGSPEIALPIEGYDALRVQEILPRLEALDIDGLEVVAQHEESRKNRSTVLNRIDELMDQLEARDSAGPEVDAEPEPVVALGAAEAAVTGSTAASATVAAIPGYDTLSEDDVVARVRDLDADQLEALAEYEETHANRDRVLDAIDDRLDEIEGVAPATPSLAAASAPAGATDEPANPGDEAAGGALAPPEVSAPVKKAAKKVAAAERVPAAKKGAAAQKAPAAKKAAPATPVPAAEGIARPAKSAPKKVAAAPLDPPAKAAAKKAAATKAPAKKAAAAKKAGAAEKAPASAPAPKAETAAAPVKKAAAKKAPAGKTAKKPAKKQP